MSVAVQSLPAAAHAHHSIISPPRSQLSLEDKYQVVKEIGDGSFGSVVLGRTRSAGAHAVRRNTMVAIKTMKKTFDSFAQCLELREVIFLTTLPKHPHLIPTYDIFLDPFSRSLHIAMEHMDGNLYQLMKAREHKQFDSASVKSIMCQILSGLEHIHAHEFFHRDIKPENILVSTSSPDTHTSFKRYSNLMTPPSTPPLYTIKIADFGLARETSSDSPYTTYVSTRWYRAPEVLLRAGAYSAPVDIWALGAMAVEVATLKPLFPGSNEVDQVWRVCEIMGSPGVWVDKNNEKVGGGEWKAGIKLAQKLGFSFPKMAPQSLESILPAPQWPPEFAKFVTSCLLWDPAARPTATQALAHDYIQGATDPLSPKPSTASRLLGRKPSIIGSLDSVDSPPTLSSKTSSWFRRSISGKDAMTAAVCAAPAVETKPVRVIRPHRSQTFDASTLEPPASHKHQGVIEPPSNKAQRDVSLIRSHSHNTQPALPLPDSVTAQAIVAPPMTKKVGRQLSINSNGNHYSDFHRNESQNPSDLASPTGSIKESFFSHLRKRARRFSGKHYATSPSSETFDGETAGWLPQADQSSQQNDLPNPADGPGHAEIDRVLQNVRNSLDATNMMGGAPARQMPIAPSNPTLRRKQSTQLRAEDTTSTAALSAPIQLSSRTRRPTRTENTYEAPDEKDEMLDEAHRTSPRLGHIATMTKKPLSHVPPSIDTSRTQRIVTNVPYLTPSSSKEDYGVDFDRSDYTHTGIQSQDMSSPSAVPRKVNLKPSGWPSTPPDDEYEWAASAAASIIAAQAAHR